MTSFAKSDEAELFHEGVTLFNDGQWFEAHETWEDIWHMASGSKKLFYQGLIQCAVTLEHAGRGNPRGVRSVWATCVPKFDGLDEVYMGINIRNLLYTLGKFIEPVLELPIARFDPAILRGQTLPINWQQAPRIELDYDPFSS